MVSPDLTHSQLTSYLQYIPNLIGPNALQEVECGICSTVLITMAGLVSGLLLLRLVEKPVWTHRETLQFHCLGDISQRRQSVSLGDMSPYRVSHWETCLPTERLTVTFLPTERLTVTFLPTECLTVTHVSLQSVE